MNSIRSILSIVFLITGSLNSQAQIQKTFGFENYDDYGQTILKATDSSFYLIGGYSYVSQMDTSGNPHWEKEIRPKDGMYFNILNDAIIVDSTDILVLSTNHNNQGNKDNVTLAKFNFNGDTIWTKSYGDNLRYCTAERVIKTGDNGFAIIGSSARVYDRYMNLLFIKTDSIGNITGSRSYLSEYIEDGIALSETEDGNFILVGNARDDQGATGISILKINSSGDTIWTKTIAGERNETSSDIIRTSSGKYLITGKTSSFGTYYHDDDLFLLEIDENGNTIWKKAYGGTGDEGGTRLLESGMVISLLLAIPQALVLARKTSF